MPITHRPNKTLSRRSLLTHALAAGGGVLCSLATSSCRQRVVQVERIVQVEKEVTKIVTEIVKETVVVERTRVETRVVQVEAATPTPSSSSPDLQIMGLDNPWTRYFLSMSEAFQELFDVQIRWQPLANWATYEGRVAAAHAAGDLPDLIETPSGVLPRRWAASGTIRHLDALVEADKIQLDGILSSALACVRHRGRMLAMPFVAHGGHHLLGYHAEQFEALGIEAPRPDWPITRLATLLPQQRGQTQGFAATHTLPEAYALFPLFGVRLFDDAGQLAVDQRRLQVLVSWLRRMAAPTSGQSPIDLVEQGQILATAITLRQARMWSWQSDRDADAMPLTAASFPLMPGQSLRAASVHAMGFCLADSTNAEDTAALWLKYTASREMGVNLFTLGLAPPGCRVASWTDSRVTEIMPLCAQIAQDVDSAPAPSLPASLEIESVIDIWNDAMRKLLDGRWTVEQCLESLLQRLEPLGETSA